jgi:hypothetical protein
MPVLSDVERIALAIRQYSGAPQRQSDATFSIEVGEVTYGPPDLPPDKIRVRPQTFPYDVSVESRKLFVPDHVTLTVGEMVWLVYVASVDSYIVLCKATSFVDIAEIGDGTNNRAAWQAQPHEGLARAIARSSIELVVGEAKINVTEHEIKLMYGPDRGIIINGGGVAVSGDV